MKASDIILVLESLGVDFSFTDLSVKTSPHSHPAMIHRIYKDERDGQWTVVFGRTKQELLLTEITNELTLGTIYQRLKLLQGKTQAQ